MNVNTVLDKRNGVCCRYYFCIAIVDIVCSSGYIYTIMVSSGITVNRTITNNNTWVTQFLEISGTGL